MCGLTQDIYLLRQALLKHFAQIFRASASDRVPAGPVEPLSLPL